MKTPFISELVPNSDATAVLLVQAKDIRQKKSGEPYLSLTLVDRTGDLDAKMWDNVEDILDSFDRDDFVRVRGRVTVYQNKPQLTIHKLVRVDDSEVNLGDFFPVSARDIDEMWNELRALVNGFTNPYLRDFLNAMLDDPQIAKAYRLAPAAKSIHHAWLGGLLEHVLSLCTLARMVGSHYKEVDLDLLLTGVVLHDIGKIHELTYERSFGYSNDGQLLGHIIIALRMIDGKIRQVPGFPEKLRILIEHMIVSHHGELEFGSPKTPMFLEALLLHHLDNLDSKMESMRQHIKKDKSLSGVWTGYLNSMERPVLKKSLYLEDSLAAAPAAAEPALPAQTNSSSAARPARKPETGSLFAEKLKGALN
jgi:3'-5' exoribonuclease